MKRTLFPIALVLAATSANAQLKSVWDCMTPSSNGHSMRVAVAPDGGVYAMAVDNELENIRITKTDSNGMFKWSKRMSSAQPWRCHITADSLGNPYVAISLGNEMTSVSRLNATNGGVVWAQTFEANDGGGLVCDPQNNIVYGGQYNLKPLFVKFNPNGDTLFSRTVDLGYHKVHSLAIAGNGTIFGTTSTGETENGSVILTPNGTVQATRVWSNYVTYQANNIAYEAVAAIDNNGRCYAVESNTDLTHIRIRPIEVNNTPAPIEIEDPARLIHAYQYFAKFDAQNRMALSYTSGDINHTKVVTHWLEFQGATIKSQKTVTIKPDPNFQFSSMNADVDQFGQAYVAASLKLDGGWTGKNQLYALNADSANPIWKSDFGPAHNNLYPPALGVGRWGQVACANHLGDRTIEQIRGTRQIGLRNVTINGYGFTGGKTITGTLSMYGSFGDARNITLTSSSNYASIAPQTTMPAGEIQVPISIDLLATSIRRAVRIEAKLGGITRSVVFYIEPPVVNSLALYPTTIKGGGSVNATARIDGLAPMGGIQVSLTSDNPAAQIPGSVLIERDATTKTFKFNTAPVSQSKLVKLTATTGTVTKTAYLTVTP